MSVKMNIRKHNQIAWDMNVEKKSNQWTIPVSSEIIAAAKQGIWEFFLTPTKPIPKAWLPNLKGSDILCLAGGGGQQGPVLAAVGANVTVFDNSPKQLNHDRLVAERDGLDIAIVEGDMTDLSAFSDQSFDFIINPVSNVFVPDVQPVWAEAFRVLKPRGALLAGFTNPVMYLFDYDAYEQGILKVKYPLPYSDADSLSEEEKQNFLREGKPLEFSHTLEAQIGGQTDAGFLIAGFYEDSKPKELNDLLSKYTSLYAATRAIKLSI